MNLRLSHLCPLLSSVDLQQVYSERRGLPEATSRMEDFMNFNNETAMRTLFKSIFAALSAVAFWACSNPDIFEDLRPSVGETVELTISTGRPEAVDTRTMVAEDGRTPLWCPEDAIGVSVFAGGSYTNNEFANDNTGEPSVTTTFSGTTAVSDWLYTYYPYTAGEVTADGLILMTVPAVQHPAATSFDGAADILVGKPVEMTKETTKIEGLQFKRAGGFLKIVLKDATSGQIITGESVECLSVTAENSLAGDAYLDIVNGELGEIGGNGSTTVTAEYPSAAYCIGSDAEAAYLGVYPQTLSQGSTITISAKTLYYEIRREIELPVDIEINAGGITTLTVNIDEANITERVLHIDEAFPDPIFRQYVSDNFDTDKDGILSKNEILAVTEINFNNYYYPPVEERISSLEGIQYFTNLTDLDCNYNQLTTLDVSKNTALKNLSCYNNQLTTLDVSKNTALVNLYCLNNQLIALDVSRNTALEDLDCGGNKLTTLDLSNNTALTSLWCENNQLTTLDLLKNTALTFLSCGFNQLTTLDLSKNTKLKDLYCYNNRLTTLDLSKNTALVNLYCQNNQLTTLDVSKNTELTYLYCQNNRLTTLDLSKNTALTSLDCYNNRLTTLDLSNNTALTSLWCDNNQLTTLDVSKNTALKGLHCHSNQLTTLDLSNNTALEFLECYNNQLTTLDVSKTNLGSKASSYPLKCAHMETLKTLYLKTGWDIFGITILRDPEYIPDHTNIEFVN